MDKIHAEVYELAKLAFTPGQIRVMLGISEEDMTAAMCDETSIIFRSYHKGYYEIEIAVRQSIFKLAKAGSSPAQTMAQQIIRNNHFKTIGDG